MFSLKIWKFGHFWIFWKITKMRAPKFHAEWSGFHAEISHMRPIQGQKLNLEIDHFPDPLKNEQFFKACKATLGLVIVLNPTQGDRSEGFFRK